ncbi:hypothetical protein P6P90_13245 [Ectobacillus antri]|uniref:Uncharacterized protein n=1 Tax=Ectobacillus antri TaxID=2486280 RepID=A0ABT6H8D7_9BACI|nr:hypothetical protein [Ectobacillus antri]MDG4658129.1 hypothetical protein [Ectobacillus antri]MDG5754925.1 hypothetical protein [Ectobacillus antri]
MESLEDLKIKNSQLNNRLSLLEEQKRVLQKELQQQLNLRESELIELKKYHDKLAYLEKRYKALSNSVLGKMMLKYWALRKKVKNRLHR